MRNQRKYIMRKILIRKTGFEDIGCSATDIRKF